MAIGIFSFVFKLFFFSFLIFKVLFVYLIFLTVVGLHCCTWAFSSCGEQGLVFIKVHGLLTVEASLLQSMGSRHAASVAVACRF